jgi:hypothetical protein
MPGEFFAESANNSVGLPSEEAIARLLCKLDGLNPDLPRSWNDDELLWTEWREPAQQVLSLIRPAFEAMHRRAIEAERVANGWEDYGNRMSDRALSAEAKLAQAVEDEREACAVIAETAPDLLQDSTFGGVARAIRALASARGETT